MAYTRTAAVFGGTGFIGRHVVRELARAGYRVKVATRVPERAYFLRPYGTPGQIVPFAVDYGDEASIARAVESADVIVNCVGILFEKKSGAFRKAHAETPMAIAKAADTASVERFVHVSALGIDESGSKYAETKREGEGQVRKYLPHATILRPGVVFGAGDRFFNLFAELARYVPALPLIGGGKTKFQPVFVGDVAGAVIAAITLPKTGDKSPLGKTYELGGPDVVDFRGIYETLFRCTCRRRALVPVPFGAAKLLGRVLGLMPNPLLTADQVESLKTDNIVREGALTLSDLGVQARDMDTLLPTWLEHFCPGGRYGAGRRPATT